MRGVMVLAFGLTLAGCSAQSTTAPAAKPNPCPAGKRLISAGDSVGILIYHPAGAADGVRDTTVVRALNTTCFAS